MSLDRKAVGSLDFEEYLEILEDHYSRMGKGETP